MTNQSPNQPADSELDAILNDALVSYVVDFVSINDKFDKSVIDFQEHQLRTTDSRLEVVNTAKQAIEALISKREREAEERGIARALQVPITSKAISDFVTSTLVAHVQPPTIKHIKGEPTHE